MYETKQGVTEYMYDLYLLTRL